MSRTNKKYIPRSCVCFTRSQNYEYDGCKTLRIKFDQNKLRKDGYAPHSIDEFKDLLEFRKLGKKTALNILKNSTFKIYGMNVSPKVYVDNYMEWEYEERIYSDIKNMGKYIISIQLPNRWNKYENDVKSKEFQDYLLKYPHIKLETYDVNKRWKITDFKL